MHGTYPDHFVIRFVTPVLFCEDNIIQIFSSAPCSHFCHLHLRAKFLHLYGATSKIIVLCLHSEKWVVPWLSHSAAGLPLQRSGFNPRPVRMGYVSKVTWVGFTQEYFGFSLSALSC
jgi:hypothetical protein